MGSVAMLLYIRSASGTFAEAGLVSGAVLLGLAVGSVGQGKLIDRFGATRTLGVVVVVFVLVATVVFASVELGAPLAVLLPVGLAFGATQPAISPASRGLWTQLVPAGRLRDAAFTYEAISIEVFFILGPAIAGFLSTSEWPGLGLLVAVILFVFGTLFFIAAPAVRRWHVDPDARGRGASLTAVIRLPGVQTLMLLVFGLGIVIGFAEVGIPAAAAAAGEPQLSGLLLGIWSLTSVVFGVWYASRPWPRPLHIRAPVLLAGFAVLVGVMAIPSELVGLTITMLVSGLLITPQSTLHSLLVERVAPAQSSGEAFGWVITAVTVGLAIGQAVSGQIVQAVGSSSAFAAAVLPGLVLAAVVWWRRGTLEVAFPGGRGHDGVQEQ